MFYYLGKLISNISNCYPRVDDKTLYTQLINLLDNLYNHIKKINISSIELIKEIIFLVTSPLYLIKGYSDYIPLDEKLYIVSYIAYCGTFLLIYFASLCVSSIKNYELFSVDCLDY